MLLSQAKQQHEEERKFVLELRKLDQVSVIHLHPLLGNLCYLLKYRGKEALEGHTFIFQPHSSFQPRAKASPRGQGFDF